MRLQIAKQLHRSPWVTVWFRPAQTIGGIVADNPSRQLRLIAALGVYCIAIEQLVVRRFSNALLDWRFLAALAILGMLIGLAWLYLSGFLFRVIGKLLGGTTSPSAVRAALAWGQAPNILGALLSIAALTGLKVAGTTETSLAEAEDVLSVLAVAFAIWAVVATCLMLGRVQQFGFWRALANAVLGWLAVWLVVVLPALAFRVLVFQPFNIPSSSMTPTLQVGDYLFAAKFAYGYSRFSLPFSPNLFSGRVFPKPPERGDVVIFRHPKRNTIDFVSRVVGLPGDRLQMVGGHLHINGGPVKRERVQDFQLNTDGRLVNAIRWRETLPNGVSHETLDLEESGFLDNTQEFLVPAEHYFMMGDNRDNALDSRSQTAVGFVPLENLVGRVSLIFFSAPAAEGAGQIGPGFHRFGRVR